MLLLFFRYILKDFEDSSPLVHIGATIYLRYKLTTRGEHI
jgi:hypothetical protein